jgi:hypothetical protein
VKVAGGKAVVLELREERPFCLDFSVLCENEGKGVHMFSSVPRHRSKSAIAEFLQEIPFVAERVSEFRGEKPDPLDEVRVASAETRKTAFRGSASAGDCASEGCCR